MNLNKAELIGNLTADPVVRKLPTGSGFASFTVATSRRWKVGAETKREVDYHPVIAWGRLAQVVAKYLKKGDKVYVDGHLRTVRFQDKEKRGGGRTEIVANNLIMLGSAATKSRDGANDAVVVEEVDESKA